MIAPTLVGASKTRQAAFAFAGLTLGSVLLLPVAFVGGGVWLRLSPLIAASLLAVAAVIMRHMRHDRVQGLAMAAATGALTVGIAGIIVQVGLLGAAALIGLTGPLTIAACIWRAHVSPSGLGYKAAVHRLVSGRVALPGAAGIALTGVGVVGVVLVAVAAGPLPTLALTALLLLAVGAAMLRLTVPILEARTLVAVLISLAIAAVPFRGLAELHVGGIAVGATEVLLSGAAAVWLSGRGARGRLHVPPYVFGLLIFAGWLLVTAVVAVNPTLVLKEVVKWLEIAVALVILTDLMREPSPRRIVAWTVAVAVLAQAGLGLVQTAAGAGPGGLVVGGVLRAFGTFDQPNPYGGYLGIHLPLILAAAIYARRSRRRWLMLLGIVVLMGVIASRSRGAWLGAGASSIVVVLAAWPGTKPWARALLVAAAAGLAAVTIAAVLGTFDRVLPSDVARMAYGEHPVEDVVRHRAHDDFAIAQRVAHWAAGWRMFRERPLLGVGAGNFDDAYRAYALHPFDEPLGHAHNVAINFGAEAGLPGMFLFAGLTLWSLGIAAAAVGRARGAAVEWSAAGSFGAMVGFTAHNMVDSLFVSGMGIVFALFLALVLAVRSQDSMANRPRTV